MVIFHSYVKLPEGNCWPIEKNWGAQLGSTSPSGPYRSIPVQAPELLERFAVLESPAGVWTPRMVAFSERCRISLVAAKTMSFFFVRCQEKGRKMYEYEYLRKFVQTRGPTWDWSCHSQKAESETAQSSTFFLGIFHHKPSNPAIDVPHFRKPHIITVIKHIINKYTISILLNVFITLLYQL